MGQLNQSAPQELLEFLDSSCDMPASGKRLIALMGQLGDFDSLEYAQALSAAAERHSKAGLGVVAIAIGNDAGAERFCRFTKWPRRQLIVVPDNTLHLTLGLYAGLQVVGGPWPSLLLMCAGIGSPGTLAEVLRGYSGDASATQRLESKLFDLVGRGALRPFELATVRLNNMIEVLGHWRTYVPRDDYLTQRGATYLLDADDCLLYCHLEKGLLGFSATMRNPLSFLEPYLNS
jgi:hypothetical protein